MTLADAHTTTTVEWDDTARTGNDDIIVNGAPLAGDAAHRVVRHLDRIRRRRQRETCTPEWPAATTFPLHPGSHQFGQRFRSA